MEKETLKTEGATAVETSTASGAQASKSKLIKRLVALVVVLAVTNPGLIPFLPKSLKTKLVASLSKVFGNVTAISSVVAFKWVTLFQLIVVILEVSVIYEVAKIVLSMLSPKSKRGRTLKNLVSSTLSYFMVLLGFFWCLSVLGVDIQTLFASVGILALIVGFGAESLIADLMTGLFMIFENEFNVGDIVELGGFRGTVSFIGMRTTSVTDAGGNVKVFNNSDMRNVVNLSSQSSKAVCDFPIPYDVKISDAKAKLEVVLDKVQKKYPETFPEKPVCIGVQELAESAVVLRIVAMVDETKRFEAARILNEALKENLEEMGISCPYNQIVVHKAD